MHRIEKNGEIRSWFTVCHEEDGVESDEEGGGEEEEEDGNEDRDDGKDEDDGWWTKRNKQNTNGNIGDHLFLTRKFAYRPTKSDVRGGYWTDVGLLDLTALPGGRRYGNPTDGDDRATTKTAQYYYYCYTRAQTPPSFSRNRWVSRACERLIARSFAKTNPIFRLETPGTAAWATARNRWPGRCDRTIRTHGQRILKFSGKMAKTPC